MKPNNKPYMLVPPEWICVIRIIAAVVLAALVSNEDPEAARTLILEVVKSLVL